MNLLHGPAIADLCDYDFGDQAGCLGGVLKAHMKDANESNLEFIKKVNGKKFMTLFIDNIRLYKRKILCATVTDQMRVDKMMEKNDLLRLLAEIMFMKETKFIIFCNNEDTPITEDILHHIPQNVLAIYAANAIGCGGKLRPFPYGLQRKLYPVDVRLDVMQNSIKHDPKPSKLLYINHAEHTNLSERGNIREMFANKSFATISPRVDYPEYCNQIQAHKFMICPEGNAVDCHRNWEVLLLKRVPIMKKNPYLQECYKDYPILWVDDYADVNKTLLAENDHLFIESRNLDINMLDLYSLFNRAVNRAKNT
mgnify:FL=1|tara:strand:- start:94 stop:1023 length:930 start_codon:yes stop_codon:yes gene_type:complete